MDLFSFLLAGVLGLLACVHFSWALGISWPWPNEKALARAVVGARDIQKMPPRLASAFVGVCLSGAGVWAIMLRRYFEVHPPKWMIVIGGAVLAIVFLARGVIGFLPAMERFTPEQPFLRLNRRIYSPLCLAIGFGFLALVAAFPNWSWRLGLLG